MADRVALLTDEDDLDAEKDGLRLFECEVNGATYWVAAKHAFDAASLLREDCIKSSGTELDEFDTVRIETSTASRAARQRFATDDGEHRSMWGEFLRGHGARVIACSEY